MCFPRGFFQPIKLRKVSNIISGTYSHVYWVAREQFLKQYFFPESRTPLILFLEFRIVHWLILRHIYKKSPWRIVVVVVVVVVVVDVVDVVFVNDVDAVV